MTKNANIRAFRDRIDSWFIDREFFMRSQGQVRFIKLSAGLQKKAAASAAVALLALGGTMGAMGWSSWHAEVERASLLEREAQVATAEQRVGAYRDDIDSVAQDLVKRQEFIEDMVDALPVDAKGADDTVTDSTSETAETVAKVSAALPEAKKLAEIEARQLAFVEKLTRFADRRAERAATAVRKLGLDPRAMTRNASKQAMGGPLEKLMTSADGSLDPRFERLGLSLARMTALEAGLDGIPQFEPASIKYISSGFGFRKDPFSGSAAMHKGLDFRGPTGAPIYAAAKGRVSFVGQRSGYGNVVEITHGNGLMTRYAHMSKFRARAGQQVDAGDVIGAIGSTGRSTGPHLHFEVRINDRAVNPRPFLETAPDVLEEVRRLPGLARR